MPSGIVITSRAETTKYSIAYADRGPRRASEDCDLRLRRSSLPDGTGCLIELARTNGHYRVAEFDPNYSLMHNGEPLLPGAEIGDGDEVVVADGGLSLRLFPVRDLPARRRQDTYVAPFIESAALESSATPRRDDAKVFLREFSRELLREINTSTKIAILLIAAAFVGGILYLGSAANRELKRSRDLIDNRTSAGEMQGVFKQQQERQHELDKTTRASSNPVAAPRFAAPTARRRLLTGSYISSSAARVGSCATPSRGSRRPTRRTRRAPKSWSRC